MDNEILFKEIDLIQACIKRMASNSFLIKGWALSIFAGVTAITKGENFNDGWLLIFTTIVPFLCFWYLDAYFLQTEREFRRMYNERLEKRKKEDYSNLYELNPNIYEVESIWRVMLSRTLMFFYYIPLVGIILFWYIKTDNYICFFAVLGLSVGLKLFFWVNIPASK